MPRAVKESRYVTLVLVQGSGQFPLDMLRYDTCVPKREVDSHLIEGDAGAPVRLVLLRRLAPGVDHHPTEGRWASMGWKVLWTCAEDDLPDHYREALVRQDELRRVECVMGKTVGLCPAHGRVVGDPVAHGVRCNEASAACPKKSKS